ncbi:hypothetical protein BO79DRAFT_230777 [Aspergillus costaricaensis CBS 115574]|uniref:Uncharacterized protein n=1 Tax=Aspergillus costaricaensis CBS 115574 TaxID=1448317 RepID=A0ACD1I830_9EURO|nr:hypothetical protein BO79DRAFT_230777 [Aspergillus costaricaensis CBS 115574]RAK86379.1 hypothetical protein BO79DRAFT_230777 [Aspergillus costaricaensis CBS 115574]
MHISHRPAEEYLLCSIKQQKSFDSLELQGVFDYLQAVKLESVAERLLSLIEVVHSNTSVTKYSLDGETRKSLPDWGDMFLSEIVYRGVCSTAMIYDDYPRIDYLCYVNEHIIAGAHWSKKEDEAGVLYFYLTKC